MKPYAKRHLSKKEEIYRFFKTPKKVEHGFSIITAKRMILNTCNETEPDKAN